MNTGCYERLPKEKVIQNHKKIVELKEQGLPLTKIAKEVNTTYGSVLYVLYRKIDNGLFQK